MTAVERAIRPLTSSEADAIDALVDVRSCSDALTEAKAAHVRMPHNMDRAIEVQERERYLADAVKRSRSNIRRVQ